LVCPVWATVFGILKCIDLSCSIKCNCSNCDQNVCNNSIVISNQSSTFNVSILSIPAFDIESSNINLTSIKIVVDTNVIILNSTLLFKSSSIISNGCINLSKSNLTVDLSNISNNQTTLLLLNSSQGCLNGSYTVTYLNKPSCTILTHEENEYSIVVALTKESDCNNPGSLEAWEIALIVVGGLVLIFIAIVLLIPPIRNKIFPFEKIRLKRTKKDKVLRGF